MHNAAVKNDNQYVLDSTFVEMSSNRRICQWCKEELSHSAYFRHREDDKGVLCPGKQRLSCKLQLANETVTEEAEEGLSETSLDFLSSIGSANSESSFQFSESSVECDAHPYEGGSAMCDMDVDALEVERMLESSSESDNDDQEEMWENTSSDESITEGTSQQVANQEVVFGICIFLNFFQLFFRISERAVLALMNFLRALLTFLASVSLNLKEVASLLPHSTRSIRKFLKGYSDGCVEYVVCTKCHNLYLYSDCIVQRNGSSESKRCTYVKYPNHPHSNKKNKCDNILMKRIKVGGKSKLVPRKTYVYHSIIQALKRLVCMEGFLKKCDHWRNRANIPNDTYTDVYEGQVWKELHSIHDRPFLSQSNNLCLMMNVDWFNPFDETPYSAGVIYFVIQNLPRNERFKFENVIIAGLIPGPSEPTKVINTYLSPVVDDLINLYAGVSMENSFSVPSIVRAVLSCVSCDIPATRKVCGFYGFNALKGCSKCLKDFPTENFGCKPDYSGYDVNEWISRDNKTQTSIALKSKDAITASSALKIERTYGARYSELQRLSYFNVVRYHVIDPMHNLFLGIAKHTLKVWKDISLITSKELEVLQERVDSMNPPPKVGRLPRKVECGFSSFTADEWRNWIVLYSPYVLYNLLPKDHYTCWCYFVEACQLICQPIISKQSVLQAHTLIVQFCKMYELLYGKYNCTPNMHLSCHLKEIIHDYGPIYGFWCFSFERYNGILERMKKSWNNPEKQLLNKFLNLQVIYNMDNSVIQSKFVGMVFSDISSMKASENVTGSLTEGLHDAFLQSNSIYKASEPCIEKCFTDSEMEHMSLVYRKLYPHANINVISRFYYEFKTLFINGEEYISLKSRSTRSAAIIAHCSWALTTSDITDSSIVGIVQSFFHHKVRIENDDKKVILARVKWFEEHPCRDFIHKSVIVCSTLYCSESCSLFIPATRILGRCTVTHCNFQFDFGEDTVTIAIPSVKNSF